MRWIITKTLASLGLFSVAAPAFAQTSIIKDGQITLGTTASYFQGDFGTPSTIHIFDESTFAQFKNQNLRIKLTIPYLAVSGLPVGAQLSGGTVVGRGNGTGSSGHGSGGTGSTGTTPTGVHSASGIGDIELAAHYTVYHGAGLTPSIVPYTKITFGTASSSKGLGTGKNNYEFGVGLNDIIDTDIFPFAHIGYRIVGNPTGDNLQNVLTYDIGASYAFTPRNIVTTIFSGSQSEQPGFAGPADLIFAYNYNLSANGTGLQVFFDKGLSNGSPNFGIGIGGLITF
ncbi:MAG: hypothetical protein KGQ79_10470 [Proteobacteria bacterium]|nr:hypothetical protein [Pseudomonadota bacterium]